VKYTFADTFYLLALFNPRDAAHERAVNASKDFQGTLITTDWVLTETADALCDAVNRGGCIAFINDLRRSSRVEIEPASRPWFNAGWDLYQQRPDKDWSLTDCISFIVMQQHGITEALTGDHHYEQAGFRALLS
jgi:predicted nucleic acid-binding protein